MSASQQQRVASAVKLQTRELTLRADSINDDARTVVATMSTEAPTRIMDAESWRQIDEVLISDGVRLPKQVALLEAHARWTVDNVLGSVTNMGREDGVTIGTLQFAENAERADLAWNLVRQGHLNAVSVGYNVVAKTDIPPGQTMKVAGRAWTASADRTLRITTQWELRELSMVPVGADAAATLRQDIQTESAAVGNNHEQEIGTMKMTEQHRQMLIALGMATTLSEREAWVYNKTQLTDKQRDQVKSLLEREEDDDEDEEEETDVAETTDDDDEDRAAPLNTRAIRKAERERQSEIREMAGTDVPADLVTRALDGGWSANKAGRRFLAAVREGGTEPVHAGSAAPAAHIRDHETDCTRDAIVAGLLHRADIPIDRIPTRRGLFGDARSKMQEQLANQGERYRAMSMMDVAREAARMAGVEVGYGPRAVIDAIFHSRAATGSLADIFTNVATAKLFMAYDVYEDTTPSFTREIDVPDFKTFDRPRTSDTDLLAKLARGDTAQSATLSATKESNRVARYARKFVVDDQDIIDDAMNALLEMPNKMGIAAAQLRPDLVYSLLLANGALDADSVALFHSDHGGNTTTGALTVAKLGDAVAILGKQTDSNGTALNLKAKALIVPQDMWDVAAQILNSTHVFLEDGEAKSGSLNPIKSLNIQAIQEGRIGVAGVTDPATGTAYTGTAVNFFLAATEPNIEVAFLAGSGRRPMIRSFVLDQGQWGIGWDVAHDIAADVLDYRGLVYSTGA